MSKSPDLDTNHLTGGCLDLLNVFLTPSGVIVYWKDSMEKFQFWKTIVALLEQDHDCEGFSDTLFL